MWKSFLIGLYILQTNVMCLKHKWSTYKYDEIFSCGICLSISIYISCLIVFLSFWFNKKSLSMALLQGTLWGHATILFATFSFLKATMRSSTRCLSLFVNMTSSRRMTLLNTLLISTPMSKKNKDYLRLCASLLFLIGIFSFCLTLLFCNDYSLFHWHKHVFTKTEDIAIFLHVTTSFPTLPLTHFCLHILRLKHKLWLPCLHHLHLVFHLNMILVFFNTLIMMEALH